jgi:hypothetical protein
MRANNSLLRDQLDVMRRREGEQQTQLSELRNQLRRLDGTMQELLDIPEVQNGEPRLANGLFEVLAGLAEMEKTLMPGGSRQ